MKKKNVTKENNIETSTEHGNKPHTIHGLLCRQIAIMLRTRSNRFQAARRLSIEHDDVTFIIAICSVGVVACSLLPLFFKGLATDNMKAIFGFTNVVFSILIVVLTTLQDSRNRLVQIELLRRSALELTKLIGKAKIIAISSTVSENDFEKITDAYKNILTNYRGPHQDIDNDVTNAQNYPWNKKIPVLFYNWIIQRRYRLWFSCLIVVLFIVLKYAFKLG
ncbi:SLATT domain-containing protein [Maridesulfovibrio sp.]|uniref:SLATT domain-containing protein n=1 Tax=unclassified Maridesulfovibrio TaxID=2794999 RepID=UPI003B00E68C